MSESLRDFLPEQQQNNSSSANASPARQSWQDQAALLGQQAKAQVSQLTAVAAGLAVSVARSVAATTAALQPQHLRTPSQGSSAVENLIEEPVEQSASVPEVLETLDLLVLIFSTLPTGHLLSSVACVCRLWREAATSPQLWQDYCDPKLPSLLTAQAGTQPSRPLRLSSCYLALHHFNFLRSPNFRDVRFLGQGDLQYRTGWWAREQGGNGYSWEANPQGEGITVPAPAPAAPYPPGDSRDDSMFHRVKKSIAKRLLPPAPQIDGVLATSFGWTELVQVVDLQAELQARGLTAAQAEMLLDAGLILGFSLQVGTRFDCDGALQVVLRFDEGGRLPNLQAFVDGPSRHHFFSGRLRTRPNTWQRYAYSTALPAGARRAIIVLRGRDWRFWQGFYGAKFAAAELRFIANAADFGAEACLQQWTELQGSVHPTSD